MNDVLASSTENDKAVGGILTVSHAAWFVATIPLVLLIGRRFEPLMAGGLFAYVVTALVSGRRRFRQLDAPTAQARLRESTGIALAVFGGSSFVVAWSTSDPWIALAATAVFASGFVVAGSATTTVRWFRSNWTLAVILWVFVALVASGMATAEECNRLYGLGYRDLPRCEPDPGDSSRPD
jgi:uncharacterized membrane protein